MSLRYQINIRILLFIGLVFLLGGVVTVWQARQSVEKEVKSSISLVLHLAQLGLSQSFTKDVTYSWLPQVGILKETRHLKIRLKSFNGEIVCLTANHHNNHDNHVAPHWFIEAVSSENIETEYRIENFQGQPAILLIEANPLDEIDEAWLEVRNFFILIIVLALCILFAVNLIFHQALKSFSIILMRLKAVESGQYHQKLPHFKIKECELIASAVNNMTESLQKTQQQNEALTSHSLTIQEEERQYLSQELHDEFGQSLTAIKVMAVAANQESADIKKIHRSIVSVCDQLFTVVRSMMRNLHPMMLKELGLKPTLEDLVLRWNERQSAIELSLKIEENVNCLDDKVSIQIFRVIQECLTNILRHAEARQVMIELQLGTEGNLKLQVKDDGKGCERDKLNSGFGVLGMQQRIKNLGGEMLIQSELGQGMVVKAMIPVNNQSVK